MRYMDEFHVLEIKQTLDEEKKENRIDVSCNEELLKSFEG